jgi:imidazole glycerol-phosphate synthase subunit HisH
LDSEIYYREAIQDMKIVIVDYGMGNLRSISGALEFLGYNEVVISSHRETILKADRLILPGVGNFGSAISNIRSLELDLALEVAAFERSTPILGICLGMQLLGISSTESGYNTGLSFYEGRIGFFDDIGLPVPHVGFNQVVCQHDMRLFNQIDNNSDFYFTHSYKMASSGEGLVSTCDYGGDFICGFEKDNIAGVQFHPELSQENGLALLKNYVELF